MLAVDGDNTTQTSPEERLWLAVLAQLLGDARAYLRGSCVSGLERGSYEVEAAYDDVMRCGPMLRLCCQRTGHTPQWVAAQFARMTMQDGLKPEKWCPEPESNRHDLAVVRF